MSRCTVLLLALCALACPVALAAEGPRQCFVVPLPEGRHDEAARLRVVLEGVTTPGDVPLKLRVTATAEDGREVYLASAGVVAAGRGATEARRLTALRLDATRALRRLLAGGDGADKLKLCVQPVDARNAPLRDLKWSVEAVRIEARRK
jgi:hypothetical protein